MGQVDKSQVPDWGLVGFQFELQQNVIQSLLKKK
jgi:hypothetical protein